MACCIARLPESRVLEVVCYVASTRPAGWPTAPGAVLRDPAGLPGLLHFAPGRWLVPSSALDPNTLLAAAAGCCATVDVTGKWQAFVVTGDGASRLLASTLAVDAALEARDCAAVTLFDCPAILARAGDGYLVWVQSSYAADFLATAQRLTKTL
jgi:sarcosine oxidase gamma subunit